MRKYQIDDMSWLMNTTDADTLADNPYRVTQTLHVIYDLRGDDTIRKNIALRRAAACIEKLNDRLEAAYDRERCAKE